MYISTRGLGTADTLGLMVLFFVLQIQSQPNISFHPIYPLLIIRQFVIPTIMGPHFPEVLSIPLKSSVSNASPFLRRGGLVKETNLDDLPLITPFVTMFDRVRSGLPHSEVNEDRFFPQHVPFCTMVLVLSILC